MRIAFAVKVRVKTRSDLPGVDSNGVFEETFLTIVPANISSDCENKDRLAFKEAGETACAQATDFFKKEYARSEIYPPTILHFQVIP